MLEENCLISKSVKQQSRCTTIAATALCRGVLHCQHNSIVYSKSSHFDDNRDNTIHSIPCECLEHHFWSWSIYKRKLFLGGMAYLEGDTYWKKDTKANHDSKQQNRAVIFFQVHPWITKG